MRVAANLSFLYQDVPLLERYAKAAASGFRLVEVPLPYDNSPEELRAAADKNGISHALINAPTGCWSSGMRGLAAVDESLGTFLISIKTAVKYAKALDCSRIHVMAGIVKEVTPDHLFRYKQRISVAAQLMHEDNITCLIEPINLYTIPNYFLHSYNHAVNVLEFAQQPNLKIQLDIFHAQQICGQLTGLVQKHKEKIDYIQVAQVPSRHEPSFKGEIDYQYVFEMLSSANPSWVVGCEYSPSSGDDLSWIKKYRLEF